MNLAPSTAIKKRRATKIHERPDLWHDSAPKKVLKAHAAGTPDKAWTIWVRHRASLRPKRTLRRAVELLIGAATFSDDSPLFGKRGWLVSDKRRQRKPNVSEDLARALADWQNSIRALPPSSESAHELLLVAYRLPFIADRLPQHSWWELLSLACAQVEPPAIASSSRDVAQTLLGIELPFVLAAQLPEIAECRHLQASSFAALESWLSSFAANESWLSVGTLSEAPWMLASVTRCLLVARATKHGRWTDEMLEQLGKIAGHLARLMRSDGSLPFVADGPRPSVPRILSLLAKYGVNRKLLRLVADGDRKGAISRQKKRTPDPGFHSVDHGIAVLKSDWSRRALRATVDFSTSDVRLELANGKRLWAAGIWGYRLNIDGQEAPSVAKWSCNCWNADDDGEFLELQGEIDASTRIERQIYLAKSERFFIVADCLTTSRSGPIELCSRLPLQVGVQASAAAETREICLAADRNLARILPLSLPEWRCDRRNGSLTASAEAIELQMASAGAGLYAPLLIDCDPGRFAKELTWRSLTVADTRQIQPANVAAGFRAQIGTKQWLVYKSIAPPCARTVLGQHLSSDFLVARFHRSGAINRLVDIEPS